MVRALLALLLAGCIPGRHPVVGTACDGEHPCPDGLACVAAVCSEGGAGGGGAGGGGVAGGAGGPGGAGGTGGGAAPGCSGQLLSDGDFEEGVFFQAYWLGMPGAALSVQGATVHGGAYAAKLAPASAGAVALRTQLTAVGAQQGSDHCVDAWVRSSDAAAPVTLQLARWLTGPDYSGASGDAVAVADGGWQRLSNRFAYPSGQVGLTVQVDTSLPAGGALFVDDVCVRVCP